MKVIEILKLNKGLINNFQTIGIRLEDARYIELYDEYRASQSDGNKVSYTVAVLAERYCISERKVYNLLKRFNSDCNMIAV